MWLFNRRNFMIRPSIGTKWWGAATSLAILLAALPNSFGQTPLVLDPTFHPVTTPREQGFRSVFQAVVQDDGRILIGGTFTHVNSVARDNLARLNPDGSVDLSFVPPPNAPDLQGECRRGSGIKVKANGDIVIYGDCGGDFMVLRPDGSLVAPFERLPLDTKAAIWDAARQSDGLVIVSRWSPSGVGLSRLKPDGSDDPGFQAPPTTDGGSGSAPRLVEVQRDDKIIVAGDFDHIGDREMPGLARLNADGSLDMSFKPPSDLRRVNSLALRPDKHLLILTSWLMVPPEVVLIGPDGTIKAAFTLPMEFNSFESQLRILPDGSALVAGTDGERNFCHVFKLNSNLGVVGRFRANVRAYDSYPDGRIGVTADGTLYVPTGERGLQRFTPGPLVTRPGFNASAFSAILVGEPGRSYRIEATSDFTNWALVTNLVNVPALLEFKDPGMANEPRRFYRAVQVQP
jgi:uncharacterized delta-60 repeat protein